MWTSPTGRADVIRNRVSRWGNDPGFAPRPVPVRTRFVWESDGTEEWVDAVAVKWQDDRVFVRFFHERELDGQEHYAWISPADVRRRT